MGRPLQQLRWCRRHPWQSYVDVCPWCRRTAEHPLDDVHGPSAIGEVGEQTPPTVKGPAGEAA